MSRSEPRAARTGGWFFLPPSAVPERWRERAEPVFMVPLDPAEAARLLEDGPVAPEMDPDEEALATLVARGMNIHAIARELGVSGRSVERRLVRLRERFGMDSKGELAAFLARAGF